jgi:hypothetical protein
MKPYIIHVAALLALTACNGNAPGQTAVAPGAANAAVKLSKFSNASFVDVATSADGTVHVIYGDKHDTNDIFRVYHRTSKDGASWTEPEILSDADPEGREVGFMRLVQAGDGTLFAVWKALIDGHGARDAVASGDQRGTLVYRAFSGGTWGPVTPIGRPQFAYAWFTSVDPNGKAHVVWAEGTTYTSFAGGSPQVAGKGDVFEAPLGGGGTPNHLVTGTLDPASEAPKIDSYDTLRGYVDASGGTHFVAQLAPMENKYAPILVAWKDGTKTKLGDMSRTTNSVNAFNSPPQLLPDANGKDQMIYWDQRQDPPVVQATPVDGGAPTVIYKAKEAGGKVLNFSAYGGPGGAAIVLVGAQDVKDPLAAPELFAARRSGGTWQPPVMLTANNQAGSVSNVNTGLGTSHIAQSVAYAPVFASAAFDASGAARLVMINNTITISGGSSRDWAEETFNSTTPDAFFLKL